MSEKSVAVVGGVDTHRDVHVVAAVTATGQLLGTASFPATGGGYRELCTWLSAWGDVVRVGVEGTGSYGAGLARHLTAAGVCVVEVNRPNRQVRRRRGKSDTADAEAAARAALGGDATAEPKAHNGPVESIRMLRITRRSALKARTQAINQIHGLILTAPDALNAQLQDLRTSELINTCARLRPAATSDPLTATAKAALRSLARRAQALNAEIADLDTGLLELCTQANPALLAAPGVGAEVAATLLVVAGDNPHRMRSEASFAALCGACPIEASSGTIVRHRLNRGGDRHANNALWRIATVRLSYDPRSRAYAARRRAEGKTRREIIRCLERHIAREIYRLLTAPPEVPHGADLRHQRHQARITLTTAADALNTHPTRISALERGTQHNHPLATRYQNWLTQQTA